MIYNVCSLLKKLIDNGFDLSFSDGTLDDNGNAHNTYCVIIEESIVCELSQTLLDKFIIDHFFIEPCAICFRSLPYLLPVNEIGYYLTMRLTSSKKINEKYIKKEGCKPNFLITKEMFDDWKQGYRK